MYQLNFPTISKRPTKNACCNIKVLANLKLQSARISISYYRIPLIISNVTPWFCDYLVVSSKYLILS